MWKSGKLWLRKVMAWREIKKYSAFCIIEMSVKNFKCIAFLLKLFQGPNQRASCIQLSLSCDSVFSTKSWAGANFISAKIKFEIKLIFYARAQMYLRYVSSSEFSLLIQISSTKFSWRMQNDSSLKYKEKSVSLIIWLSKSELCIT